MTDPHTTPERLPRATLQCADGSSATVYHHGAHVTSWQTGNGVEQLFTSTNSAFGGLAAIRGGIPVIFPQFADEGPLAKHGFARNRAWQRVAISVDTVEFALEHGADTLALWPHPFCASLRVQLQNSGLTTTLRIGNTGTAPLSFTAALHTYLRVDDIAHATVEGLHGVHYRDSAQSGRRSQQTQAALRIDGEIDRVYLDAPPRLILRDAVRAMSVESLGFADAVIWNPGPDKALKLADLEPGGYRRMLCIEAATVAVPIRLAPGEHWSGAQRLRLLESAA